MASVQELMTGLLDYVIEQAKVVDPKAFHLSRVSGFRRVPIELQIPGVHLDEHLKEDTAWLRVERLEALPAPTVPPALATLLTSADDPRGEAPTLRQSVFEAQVQAHVSPMEERERISRAFDDYVRGWRLWAVTERPRRDSIKLYADLFAMKHQIEAEETGRPMELVWGIGVSSWQLPQGDDKVAFHYPLLTQSLEVELDKSTMDLLLRPRDVPARIELEAMVSVGVPGASDVERTMREQSLAQAARVSPFNAASYEALLKVAASSLQAGGRYVPRTDAASSCPVPGTDLVVTDDWLIFSRPRSNNYLLDDIRRLKEKVTPRCELPAGPLALVSAPSNEVVEHGALNFRGLSSHGMNHSNAPKELYFPLPYNDEQVAIVEKLEQSPGVAVQGPPGTGKTHTIANVICHYLATGRRVLVTSRGEPALEVLQEKIPEEVRPLTVALLSGDRSGTRQFQTSIETIQHRVSQLNPQSVRSTLVQLHSTIDSLHQEIESIDARVAEIAQAHLNDVVVDGARLKAHKAADLVMHGQAMHGWFADVLTLAAEHSPPLSEDAAEEVRQARRRIGPDLAYLHARLPQTDALPSIEDAQRLHELLVMMADKEAATLAAPAFALRAPSIEVLTAAESMLGQLDAAQKLLQEVEVDAPRWGAELRTKCRSAGYATERAALESVFSELDGLVAARAAFLKRPVSVPPELLTSARMIEAVQRAAQTGRPFGLLSMPGSDIKAGVAAVRVAGLPPPDAETWAHVADYISLHARILSFETRWNAFARDLGVPELSGGVEQLRASERVGLAARKAHRLAITFDRPLAKQAAAVFAQPPLAALEGDAEAMASVQSALRLHLAKSELARAAVGRTSIEEHLAGKSGEVSNALRKWLVEELGQRSSSNVSVSSRYAELLAELKRLHALTVEMNLVADAAQRIRKAGAVRWAEQLVTAPCPMAGDDVTFPPTWRAAWNWARLRGHLDSIEARVELRALAGRRNELTKALERTYRESVAQAAWLETKARASGRVLQALAAYTTAIKKIGKATGPNASRYRRDARDAMVDAADAVPCWIMSHARVSESMPPELGSFDLVIIDEASQSDIWALPAVLRGKKVLVVGDDKQVSPDAGFVSAQSIDALRTRFLHNQPYAAAMTPTSSLYDLASRVFAAHQVMLREHFRCVEPIIAYSNRFYGGAIKPLRVPKASERIDPPLVDIYVPSGTRTEHQTNPAEAQVIAEEIKAIVANPRLAKRTLGVVSLLGLEQAKLIDETVRAACDATELLGRRFECGDARTFQGSERDIMFLSLVADAKNHHALSGNSAEQRFNVAASRARDRMVLVRSVGLNELSAVDLRRSLLEHFQMPLSAVETSSELVSLCESGFEREVFQKLMKAGYRTRPQVKAGSYRIDLVVEGADDRRLAIELDGDDHHGPDRWRSDVARQRILERAGWTFWRCFASTWTMNKDAVFAELQDTLAAHGIEPLGPLTSMPTLVEHRTWEQMAEPAAAVEAGPPL